ncbi:MAG: DUF177 domain-containing protein [Thermodesulfobacteriota bacterium]
MEIDLTTIGSAPFEKKIRDADFFIAFDGQWQGRIFIVRQSKAVFRFSGELQIERHCCCDRCSGLFNKNDLVEFSSQLRLEAQGRLAGEVECSLEECDTVYLEAPLLNVDELIEEQLVMLVDSGRSLCREDCKGLCFRCGADLNEKGCGCEKEVTRSPFSVLAELK